MEGDLGLQRHCNDSAHFTFLLITHSSLPLQLDIMEPKVPDDIYKTHLENNSESTSAPCVNEIA